MASLGARDLAQVAAANLCAECAIFARNGALRVRLAAKTSGAGLETGSSGVCYFAHAGSTLPYRPAMPFDEHDMDRWWDDWPADLVFEAEERGDTDRLRLLEGIARLDSGPIFR